LTQIEELKDDLEHVFAYVSNRIGASVCGKITLMFNRPSNEPCHLRGTSVWPFPYIVIYADENTSREQILGVAAHEIGHQIQYQNFGPGGPVEDAILTEGLATWAAGFYWNTWQGASSFDDSVRSYLQDGRFIPLLEYDPWDQSGDCLARRDIAYTERASFIGYLIQYYGIDKLIALFETFKTVTFDSLPTAIVPREADYKAIYGKSFQELEAGWLRYLLAGSMPTPSLPPSLSETVEPGAGLMIIGAVMDASSSARIITLQEPVDSFSIGNIGGTGKSDIRGLNSGDGTRYPTRHTDSGLWSAGSDFPMLVWEDSAGKDYLVPGTPFFYVIHGEGVITSKGFANTLEQLKELVWSGK